ncbi:unnamed protein product [Rhizophagus irregularis]|nr:unnamed protein product [Rhizophagus irregularis]
MSFDEMNDSGKRIAKCLFDKTSIRRNNPFSETSLQRNGLGEHLQFFDIVPVNLKKVNYSLIQLIILITPN